MTHTYDVDVTVDLFARKRELIDCMKNEGEVDMNDLSHSDKQVAYALIDTNRARLITNEGGRPVLVSKTPNFLIHILSAGSRS